MELVENKYVILVGKKAIKNKTKWRGDILKMERTGKEGFEIIAIAYGETCEIMRKRQKSIALMLNQEEMK